MQRHVNSEQQKTIMKQHQTRN